jgi:hypothetical protein
MAVGLQTEINVTGAIPAGLSWSFCASCHGPARRPMLKYLIPRIRMADLPPMIGVAIVGGLIAGAYGIVHDQITYTISPEYFTKMKFHQFNYADFGFGNRVFVSAIGFLATWWVGFIAAWLLARRLIPNQSRRTAFRQIRKGIVCIFAFGLSFGILGYLFGLWRGPNADYSNWDWAFQQFDIADKWPFVRVAYIHNAGYLGGFIGVVAALITIRPTKSTVPSENNSGTGQLDEREPE